MRTKDENKRLAIYLAAMKVATEDGLANTSMSKIAKAAGVSSSTIYVYFENKEDMFNKLYLMFKEESSQNIFEGFDNTLSAEDGIKLYLKNTFHYMVANPVKFSFQEQFYKIPNLDPEVIEQGLAFYAPIFSLYKTALEQNLVKNHPGPVIKAFFNPPILYLVQAHLNGDIKVTEDILDKAVDMAWQAIKI